jgi:hypothetical protein
MALNAPTSTAYPNQHSERPPHRSIPQRRNLPYHQYRDPDRDSGVRHEEVNRRILRPRPPKVRREQRHRRAGETREIGEFHQRPGQRQARDGRHPQRHVA